MLLLRRPRVQERSEKKKLYTWMKNYVFLAVIMMSFSVCFDSIPISRARVCVCVCNEMIS